jgi:hypothetical protein
MTVPNTPAHGLFLSALDKLINELHLVEASGAEGGPHLTLMSHAPFHQGQCGSVRIYHGSEVFRVITCSISAPAIGLDSHMLFAFAASDTAKPHFTVDSVKAGDHLAFHLDLIPRLDLGTHLGYMDWVYAGLNDAFDAGQKIEGLTPAHISPRQRAVMSPWMLVNRADESAFAQITPLVHTYIDHWLGLLRSGAPELVLEGATPAALAERDKRNKAIIFDPDVDKVWNQIRGLVGTDAVEAIRGLLTTTSK